jgi:serine/threonine protein kinase
VGHAYGVISSPLNRVLGSPTHVTWPELELAERAGVIPNITPPIKGDGLRRHCTQLLDATTRATVTAERIPDVAIDLLEKLLTYSPSQRITAAQALKHPYFTNSGTFPPVLLPLSEPRPITYV